MIQTDNGAEFGASFHWHVLDKGMQHVYIKPRTPRLNGKVERSHRIDARSSTGCSTGSSSTTPTCSTTSSGSGRTTTTTTDSTAASAARPLRKTSPEDPHPGVIHLRQRHTRTAASHRERVAASTFWISASTPEGSSEKML